MPEPTTVDITGISIGAAIEMIEAAVDGITSEELAEFERYLEILDTSMPITDPTRYAKRGREDIEEAQKRVRLLKHIKGVLAEE